MLVVMSGIVPNAFRSCLNRSVFRKTSIKILESSTYISDSPPESPIYPFSGFLYSLSECFGFFLILFKNTCNIINRELPISPSSEKFAKAFILSFKLFHSLISVFCNGYCFDRHTMFKHKHIFKCCDFYFTRQAIIVCSTLLWYVQRTPHRSLA